MTGGDDCMPMGGHRGPGPGGPGGFGHGPGPGGPARPGWPGRFGPRPGRFRRGPRMFGPPPPVRHYGPFPPRRYWRPIGCLGCGGFMFSVIALICGIIAALIFLL